MLLPHHQQRVYNEKIDLDDKLSRLSEYFSTASFKSLHGDEQGRLHRQATAMHLYSGVLGERLEYFNSSGK